MNVDVDIPRLVRVVREQMYDRLEAELSERDQIAVNTAIAHAAFRACMLGAEETRIAYRDFQGLTDDQIPPASTAAFEEFGDPWAEKFSDP